MSGRTGGVRGAQASGERGADRMRNRTLGPLTGRMRHQSRISQNEPKLGVSRPRISQNEPKLGVSRPRISQNEPSRRVAARESRRTNPSSRSGRCEFRRTNEPRLGVRPRRKRDERTQPRQSLECEIDGTNPDALRLTRNATNEPKPWGATRAKLTKRTQVQTHACGRTPRPALEIEETNPRPSAWM